MVSRLLSLPLVLCGVLDLVSNSVQASSERPSYIDRYGVVIRSGHGGVNACREGNPEEPLFTREGTLACASIEGFSQAIEIIVVSLKSSGETNIRGRGRTRSRKASRSYQALLTEDMRLYRLQAAVVTRT